MKKIKILILRNLEIMHKSGNPLRWRALRAIQYTLHLQHNGREPISVATKSIKAFIALTFAVLMGCNPIYVSGLDLDYSLGYATNNKTGHRSAISPQHIGAWKVVFKDLILDDLRILKESAELKGIRFINLNDNSWHDTLPVGKLIWYFYLTKVLNCVII